MESSIECQIPPAKLTGATDNQVIERTREKNNTPIL